MKSKMVSALILGLLIFTNGFSQKSIIKLQIGYGLPLTNSLASVSTQVAASSTMYTGVYGSYGSGLKLEGGYIRPFNAHLSVELDVSYLFGKPINASYTSQNNYQHQSSSSHFYEISPLLRINLGGSKVKPYAALGPVVGFGNLTYDNTSNNGGTANGSEVQRKYSGSTAIGAKSAVGVELTQGKFIFYGQITMIAMSYAPGKSEYTKYTLNGVDQLAMMTISQKQSVYKSSFASTTNSPDPNQPSEDLKFYVPFSSISLNVGVMFKF